MIAKGIADMKAEGDRVSLTMSDANADLPFLMVDYHLNFRPGGGGNNAPSGNGTCACKVVEPEAGSLAQCESEAAAAPEADEKPGHDGSPIVLQVAPGAVSGAVEARSCFRPAPMRRHSVADQAGAHTNGRFM